MRFIDSCTMQNINLENVPVSIQRLCLVLVLAIAALGSSVQAQVHRSPNGVGGALILPYWTTSVGNDSLISIRNDSEQASAIKLLWLDEQGGLVLSANLYLNARSIWAGAATNEIDSQMVHTVQPNACLLPLALNEESEFGPWWRAFPLGAPRGSMEVIEMASAAVDSPLAPEGQWIDCDALAERWGDGPWAADSTAGLLPPAGQLSANNNLINVALGGMNTIEATALQGFSDIVQHTAPQDPTPNLSGAVDSTRADGRLESLACSAQGCRLDLWSSPIEAVAAVLTATELTVDYNVNPGVGAEFDWIIHRPLERYEGLVQDFSIGSSPQLSRYDRRGEVFRTPPPITLPVPIGLPPETSNFPFPENRVLQSVTIGSFINECGEELCTGSTPILGHPAELFGFSSDVTADLLQWREGSLRMDLGSHDSPLESNAGVLFLGEPVISVGFQQFTNGAFPGGVLANYRGTEAPRYELTVLEPE
jgi:hypothetical protein